MTSIFGGLIYHKCHDLPPIPSFWRYGSDGSDSVDGGGGGSVSVVYCRENSFLLLSLRSLA